ncbi:VWA domain-containing protein [Actinomadura parmotrematis]|uniref:Substrate-binding and VWA domain-containing protein n=1 Tax=Actinomadura parmotrematis TaxID=2864039 RepID=A0ABS7FP23_9ACTN|nr:VWA domain-containing protein [Actinomadura parmotrematis]MBW8482128.1 substrate-binding and VWA domain-containing protein [Actinomadura parmotrematis]
MTPPAVPPAGRHRSGRTRGGGVLRAAAAALLLALSTSAYVVHVARSCGDGVRTLDVAAAPEIAAAAAAGADAGPCTRVSVRTAAPETVTALLTGRLPGGGPRPDVWLPDSTLWTRQAGVDGRSVASSPIGMTGPGAWRDALAGRVRLRIPDPGRSAVGLAVLMRARTSMDETAFAAAARRLRQGVVPAASATVLSEQAARARRAAFRLPQDGSPVLDYPLVTLRPSAGAARFERSLLGSPVLAAAGFRAPAAGSAPPAARVRAVLQSFDRLALGSRMLSLIDVSAPMAPRLRMIARVSQEGLALQPDDTELGQWVFAGRWRRTVPLGPLGERLGSSTRRQALLGTLAALRAEDGGGTRLYASILAAFHALARGYRPEMVNTVLVFTGGRDADPAGPSLDATVAELRRDYDPARPVQVITVGFGPDVDTAALRRIGEATHGGVYVAERPADIRRIFAQAMARRVCAPSC